MSDSSNGPVYIDDSILGFSFNPNIVTPSTSSQPSRDAYTYVNETLPDVFNDTYTAMTAWGWQLDWPFVGNYVQVIGLSIPWISGDLATATFSVDDQTTQTFTAPNVSVIQINVSYFTATPSDLSQGNHVLHVNITTASPDSPWLLDYLIIATNPSPAQVSISPIDIPLSTASPSNTGNTTTASSSSHASKPTTNVSRPDPSDTSSLSSFPLAPVIGGAAGGIVLVAALLALLFYLLKRWRKPTLEKAVVGSNRHSRGDEPRLPQVTLPRSDPGRVAPRIYHREESVSSRVSTLPLASGSMTRPSMVAAYPSGSGSSYAGPQGWSQHGQPTEWAREQAVYPPVSMASTSYSGSAQWQQGGVHAQRNWRQPDYPTMPSPASGFGPGYSPPHPAIYPHPHLASNPITSADRGYFAAPLTKDVDPSFHTGSAEHTSYPPNPGFAPSIAERPHARSTSSLMGRASTSSPRPVASHAAIAAEMPGSRTVTPFLQASQAPHPSIGVVLPGPTYDATAAPFQHSAKDSTARRMASVADSSSSGTTVPMLGGVMEFDGKVSRLISDRGVNRAEVDGDVDSTSKDSSEDGQRTVTAPPAYSP